MPPRPSPPRLYLRKRRDGANTWIILDCGRQISTGALADDRRAAEEALENYLGQKHRPSFGDGHPARVAVVDVLSAYAEKHGPTTARPDLIAGAVLKLGDYFEGHMVATITPENCQDYLTWRCEQRDARAKKKGKLISSGTARRELVVLAAALNWCWKNKRLDRPIPIKLPLQSEPRERHLTRSEAARLLAGALGWDKDGRRHHYRINRHLARFILIGLYTSTRHDAILRLQWIANTTGGHVDLDDGVIYRRPRTAIETSKRKPPLPVPPRLLPHLRRWRRHTARFLIEWNGLPIASQERRAWSRARELAGLGKDVTPHVLRHTCATWLLQSGVPIYDVAGVLGCSEAVVRKTYGHHAKDHLRGAVATFSRRPAGNGSAMNRG
jgi:integrase